VALRIVDYFRPCAPAYQLCAPLYIYMYIVLALSHVVHSKFILVCKCETFSHILLFIHIITNSPERLLKTTSIIQILSNCFSHPVCVLCFLSCQSRRSSSRGKRRCAPRAPPSPAGGKVLDAPDRTPTPVVGPTGMCHQKGSPRSAG